MAAGSSGDRRTAQQRRTDLVRALAHEDAKLRGQIAAVRRDAGASLPPAVVAERLRRLIQARRSHDNAFALQFDALGIDLALPDWPCSLDWQRLLLPAHAEVPSRVPANRLPNHVAPPSISQDTL